MKQLKSDNCCKSPEKYTIDIALGEIDLGCHGAKVKNAEAYHLAVSKKEENVTIIASDEPGAFYAVQSFLSLLSEGHIPEYVIQDAPRYPYRGMHLDVARNFHGKDQVLKLLDAMAMYKMNKLHLHLTDDEGWRIEIPGLEELTAVSSTMTDLKHNMSLTHTSTLCLLSPIDM